MPIPNEAREHRKAPITGAFVKRMMGLEPTTFCMASRRSSQLSYIRVGRKYSDGQPAASASSASFTSWSASLFCSRRTAL